MSAVSALWLSIGARERASWRDQNRGSRYRHCDGYATMERAERGESMIYPEISKLHPHPTPLDRDLVLRCIQECLDCVASCIACADDCLSEDDRADMVRCIRLDLDCADVCEATGRVLIRQTTPDTRLTRASVEACALACLACAEECERHAAHHEHCRLCAEICRRCQQVCEDLLATLR
jgi:Domain of Unknown Function (DUF326)